MAITPLPPAPQITDDPATFNTKANAFVGALPTFVTETNALATQVDADAASAAIDADDAQAASLAAVAAANYKGEWSSLTGALNIPASVSHNGAVWVLTQNLADVTTDEPGAGSPSAWLIVTLPAQAGNEGKFLTTDGNQTSWEFALPNQISNSGKFLTTDGNQAQWQELIDDVQIGTLQYFAGTSTSTYPGDKWLLCDGSVVTQTAYSDLFSVLGAQANNEDNWVVRTSGTTSSLYALTYGNGLYIYGGHAGALATSTNAITWTARTSGSTLSINTLAYGNGVYIYGADNPVGLGRSTDGISWSSTALGFNIFASIYANGIFVTAGNSSSLYTSTDAITWTPRNPGAVNTINALTYGNGLFVYGGVGGALATSTNAITWTARTSGTASGISSLTYGNGLFVYGGGGGVLATSTNGITWTARTSGTTLPILALTYANGLFIYGGGSGTSFITASSKDGINWTVNSTSTTTRPVFALTSSPSTFVRAGGNGFVHTNEIATYNFSTQFALPNQEVGVDDFDSKLYIKAE